MSFDLTTTLAELVAIPSVNPMGRPLCGPEYFETRVTDYLEKLFRGWGLACRRQPVEPSRDNIVAALPGDGDERLVVFDAHQDTVPVDGMTIPPFTPSIQNGRLYGRGSCDIKGGMTAMLGALHRLTVERPKPRPTVCMVCTINEENGFSGALKLLELWRAPSDLFPRPPDAVIVAEPTELDVVVAHKGATRWLCRTHGRAAHSSQPERGDNALYRMARVLLAMEEYQRDELAKFPAHPLCCRPTLSVGVIRGGVSVNTVPDECVVECDRRLVPGEDPRVAREHLLRFLRDRLGPDFPVAHDDPWMWGMTLNGGANEPLAQRLSDAAATVAGRSRLIGVPYGTNAAPLSKSGAPAVVFGPGSIAQAHTCDEWVELAQVEAASEVLYRFVVEFARA